LLHRPSAIPNVLTDHELIGVATPDLAGRMLGALLAGQAAGQDPDLKTLYDRADFKALVGVSESMP
jgi:hypothetical protein